jgi:hypothetical protein
MSRATARMRSENDRASTAVDTKGSGTAVACDARLTERVGTDRERSLVNSRDPTHGVLAARRTGPYEGA